ncbi:MAG: GDYXXLXY domain-containing protein [Myxococcota bacterium]|nr:GDYXXLXY domain-containing protein [Myxococcota bacterium]
MTQRRMVWVAFALACLAQLAFASSSMWQAESTLHRGTLHYFRTDPVDPVDPFRGRYVALAFRSSRVPLAEGAALAKGETAYVELGVGDQGNATLERAHAAAPEADHLALPVERADGTGVFVRLPFERYYAEEGRAIEIDRQRWRTGARFRVGVRVLDGHGVIESLELAEVPAPLLPGELLRPDPDAPLPEGLFEALRKSLTPWDVEGCRARGCLLFEVDLDRRFSPEFAFLDADAEMSYWLGLNGAWRRSGRLLPSQRGTVEARELLEWLRVGGASSAEAPVRDLLIGERTWGVYPP